MNIFDCFFKQICYCHSVLELSLEGFIMTQWTVHLLNAAALTPEDVSDLIDLRQELSPHKPRITKEDVVMTVQMNAVFAIRDPISGRLVAMATLIILRKLEGPYGYVHDVVTAQSCRGNGLGRLLMNAVLDEARHRELLTLELTSADTREQAVALYSSLGFTIIETNFFRLKL